MKTGEITILDVAIVARSLKMVVSAELIQKITREYDNYAKDRPNDHWSEIVETMLYDYTDPVLRYNKPDTTAEPDRFWTDGDGGDDVNLNFLG
jgi:hypothetical protein